MVVKKKPLALLRPIPVGLIGFVLDREPLKGALLDNLLRIGLFVCVGSMAFATVWLGYNDKTGAAGITAGLCFGLCIFLFLSRFKRFKGLGFEGELWEQEMEKAAELRLALNDLTAHVAENVYWDLGEGGRLGRKDTDKILGIIERADRNLEAAGVDRFEIEEMKRPWHKCIMRDLAYPITEHVRSILKGKMKAVEAELKAFGPAIDADSQPRHQELGQQLGSLGEAPKQLYKVIWRDDYENVPRLLRQAIEENPLLADEDKETLYANCADEFLDIEQYARERTVRRPELLRL